MIQIAFLVDVVVVVVDDDDVVVIDVVDVDVDVVGCCRSCSRRHKHIE